ncbi:MAG: FTR1 family iron permease [Burkholderiales bacterium]
MLGVAVIVFREVLEAALIIGVVTAASRGIAGRTWALGGGVAAGVVGALFVAAFAEGISKLARGMGQEIFNASVLGLAVIMLAWHCIWMAQHGAAMAADAKRVTQDVRSGSRGLAAIAIVAALAVLREGAETVLFLYGMAAGNGLGASSLAAGGALGVLAGAGVGFALYGGLLRIPVRHFFSVTGVLVLLVAAGLAGQMARFLIQADVLSALRDPLWDTSWLLGARSAVGSLLRVLVGYDPRPSGMQMLFYVATLVLILAGARLARSPRLKS